MINQITMIGTGLIGGSLGLALKRAGFAGRVVGCDRADVLARARQRGAIDFGEVEAERAIAGSQVVVLATPVMTILELIGQLGPSLAEDALLTDTGSTKAEILRRAQQVFGDACAQRFLPGHPMAGKERGGIDEADSELFLGATWVITPKGGVQAMVSPEFTHGHHGEWMSWLEKIGTRVIVLDAERHDRVCAYTSHLPQMVSTALAATVVDALEKEASLLALAGAGMRDMVRLSASDYAMWRDIALTNSTNLHDALLQMEQTLAHIRENLKTRELQKEFERAQELDLETPPEERAEER